MGVTTYALVCYAPSKTKWMGQTRKMEFTSGVSAKDVECIFGILKKWFLVLKYPSHFHKMEDIGNVFSTCCVLHNMLLEWEWDYLFDEDDVDVENYTPSRTQQRSNRPGFSRATARPYVQPDTTDEVLEEPLLRDAFDDRRDGLIEHYFAS
jgi:hypothetical protein